MSTGIAVRGLSCRYPEADRPALDGLDLEVPAGTLTVVMGHTGAGKSTLARCLTRIVPCFVPGEIAGTVALCGESVDGRRVSELAGTIGMVFQDFEAQLFSGDVMQEVVFGMEQTAVAPSAMSERAFAALAAVGLNGFERRDPATLSGGEKQRLALAGLLALRPRLMVLDEPTTDLDPSGRAEILALLATLRREALAVLVMEHETAAAVLADQLVLLREGRMVACDRPATVLRDVARCRDAGVRPHDVCAVFAALDLPDPPLEVDAAAERLRTGGLLPVAPAPLEPGVARAGAPLLAVRDLSHRWADGRAALTDVSLRIHRGEFIALVGRNGSGKTTLAKHLNGLLRPTTGQVTLEDRDVASLPLEDIAQRVGFVFQDPDHQLFAASVEEEVGFGPRNLGLGPLAVAHRVDEALAAVGLTERGADPFLLDKGARQRLAVASILALRPDVLVLDEPTTGLDWPEQLRMLQLLRDQHRAGRTIVMITHTPWVIAEYAQRVLLLADGQLAYDGGVREFFTDPARLRLASFRPPDVTRLGLALGCVPLSVDELVGWIRPGGQGAC